MQCQMSKASNVKIISEPTRIISNHIGEVISVDQYGPLPESRGGVVAVLVFRDLFSGYVHLFAMKNTTAENYINKLKTVVKEYANVGVSLKSVLSDNGPQFRSKAWQEGCRQLGITPRTTTVYNPQSSPIERTMREIGVMLRIYLIDAQERLKDNQQASHRKWSLALTSIQESLNSLPATRTGLCPNEIVGASPIDSPFKDIDYVNLLQPQHQFLKRYVALQKLVTASCSITNSNLQEIIDGKITNLAFFREMINLDEQTMLDEDDFVLVYTDGACFKNGEIDAVGSVGVYFCDNSSLNYASLLELPIITNNITEVYAAIIAVKIALAANIKKLNVISDSAYLVTNYNDNLNTWLNSGWKKSDKKIIENIEYWKALQSVTQQLEGVKFTYVKGHKYDYGNYQADKLAQVVLQTLRSDLVNEMKNEPICSNKLITDRKYRQTCYERYIAVKNFLQTIQNDTKFYKTDQLPTKFKINDVVKIINHVKSDKNKKFAKKLAPKYSGPYVVIKEIRPNLYRIKNQEDNSIVTVNIRQLRPCN